MSTISLTILTDPRSAPVEPTPGGPAYVRASLAIDGPDVRVELDAGNGAANDAAGVASFFANMGAFLTQAFDAGVVEVTYLNPDSAGEPVPEVVAESAPAPAVEAGSGEVRP